MKRNELKIASPCHENFDEMQGAGAKRFCGSCSKHVTNLSDMTKSDADQFLKAAAGTTVCVRYEFDSEGQVIFGRPAPDRVQRQMQGARKMLAAAAMVMIPLLSACVHQPADCERSTPETTLIQSEQAILEKLKEAGIDLRALADFIDPFDPYEDVVLGEFAVVEPMEDAVPVFAELEVIPDEMATEPEPEPEVREMMGDIAVAPALRAEVPIRIKADRAPSIKMGKMVAPKPPRIPADAESIY